MDFHAIIVFHELLHVFHNLNGERLKVPDQNYKNTLHFYLRRLGLLDWEFFLRRSFQKINFVKRLEYHAEYPIRTTQLSFMMTIQ